MREGEKTVEESHASEPWNAPPDLTIGVQLVRTDQEQSTKENESMQWQLILADKSKPKHPDGLAGPN